MSECGIITCKFSAEYRQYAYVTMDEWMNASGVFVHPCGDGPLHRINHVPNVYFLEIYTEVMRWNKLGPTW